jgi:hypothetical protein
MIDGLMSIKAEDIKAFGSFLLKALRLSLAVSTLPFEIGSAIAAGIFTGFITHLRKEFPRLAKFMGVLTPEETQKKVKIESLIEKAQKGEGVLGERAREILKGRTPQQLFKETAEQLRRDETRLAFSRFRGPAMREANQIMSPITIGDINIQMPPGTTQEQAEAIAEIVDERIYQHLRESSRNYDPVINR